MASSGTGESDTTDPIPVVSDDRVSSEREVYTSDTISTDDDDFQPFALPDAVIEPADGPIAGDLPLVVIPAPIPLAMYPVIDMPLDVVADDDVDLFDEEPLEDDVEGEALIAADDLLLLADAPTEESPAHSPVPDSFDSVASAPSHAQGAQHYSHDSDPDRASSAAPAPALCFAIDHDIDEDSDPDEHAVDAQVDALHIADIPADPVIAPPFPDPVPLEPDHALFATHVDPSYAHTRNGWIDDDDEYPPFVVPVTPVPAPASAPFDAPLFPTHTADANRADLPITFLQEIPPPRPGEGSSRQPFGHAPFLTGGDQFAPQIPHHTAVPPVAPFTVPSFTPSSEPFLWTYRPSCHHLIPIILITWVIL
ncbi:uncharacterized protein LOC110888641 [Helianthus annuus]|uniref:uncharacterized protein LOC110888641 n=1 Tax=Helianthus annuus TaxID=4232 RepID=UPI000B9014D1|nr:uncharacterized protein LOC110888641 [Helianthus annuus]